MFLCEKLLEKEEKLALIGLGYVGMPIAIGFAAKVNVIGYDLDEEKIELYKNGIDPTNEVSESALRNTTVDFTADPSRLKEAKFHIVAVPTPINLDKTPDLSPVENASRILGKYLTTGSIVVFESTVYPGVTEGICVPILEHESGLKCGVDFKVGYSPERINPGDKVHTLSKIKKIVSGMDSESLTEIKNVYDLVIEAGTFPVSTIKVAEAIKVAENSQRDVNIAFINELAMVFDRMGIDTNEVIEGMNTKWNALGFMPGLVGGHCIGVDPYYFVYEAERLGYHSQIILAGRRVNDEMGSFIADAAIREMIKVGLAPAFAKVVILGLTFKENCPDVRNSKVGDIVSRLGEYGIVPEVVDPWASIKDARAGYGIELKPIENVTGADCVILAVSHTEFCAMKIAELDAIYKGNSGKQKVLIDVKGLFDADELRANHYAFWRL